MLNKIWTIAWKEIYTTFTDRNLILIMIASPLALSTIVGLAFGGLGGDDLQIDTIPIAVVNLDRGGELGVSYGDVYVDLLVPGGGGTSVVLPDCPLLEETSSSVSNLSLSDFTKAEVFDTARAEDLIAQGQIELTQVEPGSSEFVEQAARAAVERGIYTSAIIIPADFTSKISYVPVLHPEIEATGVTVYSNRGSPITSGIIRSIAEGITNRIATGNITIAATFHELETRPEGIGSLDFALAFSCAFTPISNTLTLEAETVEGEESGNIASQILVWVGSAQAMFFALFTAQFGVLGMHSEKREGTLQRLVVSPTPRSHILAGKLIGVFLTVIFQMVVLLVALTLIGSLLQGQVALIWGENWLLILALVVAAALAVSGFGMLIAGIVRTPEQGQIVGPITNMAMAVLGGAFGFTMPKIAAVFSIVFWGREAFQKLAAGQSDIGVNLAVLAVQGIVMYALGVVIFNRRFEF
jgi:ABC-type transport system involved in multi-copper enzyme maturation permease subunit